MSFDVSGQVALVTGANRGIGRKITEALVAHGAAKVYAAVRDPLSADSLRQALGDLIVPLALDLTRPETVEAAAQTASDATLVINNAGVLRTATPFADDALESLQFELDVNLYGLIHMARSFGTVLKANGGGAFVQLNSVVSMKCFADFTTYCASKAAAYSVTQSLRTLWRDQGTLVVSVHPGPIATDMGRSAGLEEMADPPEVVAEAIVAGLKAGDFHVFPDAMARQIGAAYRGFAEAIVEADLLED